MGKGDACLGGAAELCDHLRCRSRWAREIGTRARWSLLETRVLLGACKGLGQLEECCVRERCGIELESRVKLGALGAASECSAF